MSLSGSNTISGEAKIYGGTLAFTGGSSTLGDITNNAASLTFSGNSVVNADSLYFESYNPQLTITDNADVTVTGGITHRASVGGDPYHAANYIFAGGTLRTAAIAGPSIVWNQAGASMHFDGTRIVATADNADFITTIGWDHATTVNLRSTGGAVFDTAGFNVGIQVPLVNESGHTGKLTKLGAGTLTLSANNSYSGGTFVRGGVLSFSTVNSLPATSLDITNGAKADLAYSGTVTLNQLVLNGVVQTGGTYGSSSSGAQHFNDTYFSGTGLVNIPQVYSNQVVTWQAAVNNNWDASTDNWTNNVPYTRWYSSQAAPNNAIFDATGPNKSVNVTSLSTLYANALTFNDGGYDIGGGPITLGNTPTVIANSNATISAVLNGAGGVTKTGNGTLTLTGANSTYGGSLTVVSGTLEIGGSGNFDQTVGGGQVTVSNGATLLLSSTGNNALPLQGGTPAWVVAGTLNVTGGGANTVPGAGIVLNNGTLAGTPANVPYGTFLAVQGARVITANGSANSIASDNFGISGPVTLNTPLATDALVASTAFFDSTAGAGSLLKTGLGTVMLNGNNAHSGSTTVSGGTLGGSGTISGTVTVETNATLTAGSTLGAIGTLTLANDLNLNTGANVLVKLNKSLAQSNSVISVSGLLVNNGGAVVTLTVSNLGPALVVGDKFPVFSKAFDQDGNLVTIVAPAGYAFTNDLAVDGSITVTAVPSVAPPTLGYTQSGSNLTFTWSGTGSLEWQTNALTKGLSTNWVAYPNGTNGVTVPINPANRSVFFRVKQ